MAKEFFPQIGKIPFEGTTSKNVLAFHYYEPERVVMGKKMKDWMRFAMAWWHTLGQASGDPFGGQTRSYEWDKANDPIQRAKDKMDAGFELMDKLGIHYFCFHDVDLIEEGATVAEYEERMCIITDYALEKMRQYPDIHLLWGTANVFGHKRYMNGAATNPDFDVVARAVVQIKNSIDAIKQGRTVIIISHNIGQIIDADQIYVLENGRVVQNGTPDEVYRQGGVYKDIFDASARSMNADKIAATLG